MDMITIRRKLMAYIPQTTPGVLPSEFQQAEYLESDRNSYIDTGIVLTEANYSIFADVMLLAKQDGKLFGIRKYQTGQHSTLILGAKDAQVSVGTNWQVLNNSTAWVYSTGNDVFQEQRYKINFQYGATGLVLNVNGVEKKSLTFTPRWDDFANLPMYLFVHHSGYVSIALNECQRMRCYGFSIKRNNRTVLDLVPCYRKSDSMPGMYDLVSDTFLTNSGTGTFTVGPDIN